MKVIFTDVDGIEVDIGNDKDKLRNYLSYLYGSRHSHNQMQIYIQNEMSKISDHIEKIESLLSEE